MPIYSYEGLSIQIIDETSTPQPPNPLPLYDNEGNRVGEKPAIEMQQPRPSYEHIASTTGEWILPPKEGKENGTEENAS